MKTLIFILLIYYLLFLKKFHCEESSVAGGTKCVNYEGEPKMCYPPFQNHASAGLKIVSTNTCGMSGRQKYCLGLSSAEMRSRCAYCDDNNPEERHSVDYLTDHNVQNWWQSETLADNKTIHYEQSINLTLNLGKQFHVTFIHLQFKSPRPRSMVIYRKYDDHYPWTPWLYLASNCKTYFNMSDSKGKIIERFDDVLCTEEFSSLNDFYNGIVMFATIFGRPGADDFFNNKKIMDWATASQIRIELKTMHTFGDQNAEEELLLTYFYAIKSIQVAARCWCNGHGNECRKSTGEGVEPKLFCVCHPAHHTTGQSCEKCDNFYYDVPWQMATANNPNVCKRCNCNDNSDSCIFKEDLYIKSGNVSGGFCINCLGNTKGPHCEECIEGFYKDIDQPNRCIPCNCDPRGRESVQCDRTGKCVCHPGVDGDKCTRCKGDHYNFGPSGCQQCNCNLDGVNSTARLQCNPSNGICYCKKNVIGEKCDSCVQGYFSLTTEDPLGCRPCFCFAHTKYCTSAAGFVTIPITSEFKSYEDDWKYGIGIDQPIFTPKLDFSTNPHSLTWFQNRDHWKNNFFLWAPIKFIGDQRMSYNLFLDLTLSFSSRPDQDVFISKLMSMANDVELVSDIMSVSVPFNVEDNNDLEVGKDARLFRFRLNEESGLWRDRMDHFRFISILSNLTAVKIRLTNPQGFTKLHKVVLYTAVEKRLVSDRVSNFPITTNVEMCSCPIQYTGLSCEDCAIGYHRLSAVGTEFVKCIKCMCNNQSDVCDVRTGKCDCQYNTTGHNCERCVIGYYGDPTTLNRNVCQPCGCPGGTSCELVKMVNGNVVVCTDCPDNLGGYRCNRCRDNYFGNPRLNISCQPCNCHGNIEYMSSCDSISGKCSNCLYNSAGDYCEICKIGYHLSKNEFGPNRCKKCECSHLGSIDGGISCDVITGQCYCHPLVIGSSCSICQPGYFNISPGVACEPCNCFIPGTIYNTCDITSGQCFCKPGVIGTKCDKCEFGYYNLSQSGCQRCECDSTGSQSQDCNITTGECICKTNIVGPKCDQCMENHYNITGGCPNCPPCYSLILRKITVIKEEISVMLQNVNSMNESDSGVQNITNLIDLGQELHKTINGLFDVILKDYKKFRFVKEEIVKSKKLMKNASQYMFDIQTINKNEQLKVIISEIKSLKENIEYLIKRAFNDNLQRLKKFIDEKSMTDSNITKIAEMALNSLNEVNSLKNKISNEVLKTEKDFNNSLTYFVELVTSYYNFINESKELDILMLGQLSKKITSDALTNLNDIDNIDRRQNNMDKLFNDTNQRLKDLNLDTDKLFTELSIITNSARDFEKKLQMFMISLPNLEAVEKEITLKSSLTNALTKNMTNLQDLKRKLDDAQNNITNALSQAQKNLLKLQGISKDFDEAVKASKSEATIDLNKLPELKTKLDLIQSEIEDLRQSSFSIIESMKISYNRSQLLYTQSNNLELKYKILLSQTSDLVKKSIEDYKFSVNIRSIIEKGLQNESTVLSEIQNITKILQETTGFNKIQKNSSDNIETLLQNIENQLKKVEEQASIMIDDKIDEYSKLITSITSELQIYEDNQIRSLTAEIGLIDEEWMLLNKEMEDADAEIERLESINKYMIGSTICHKSGGKIER